MATITGGGINPIVPLVWRARQAAVGRPDGPDRWVALDMETATADPDSVCGIGVAVMERGRIVERRAWFVRPPGNLYDPRNTGIHRITPEHTAGSPDFSGVWPELAPYLDGQDVLFHWYRFDVAALRALFDRYAIQPPSFRYACTVEMSRRAFPGVSSHKLPDLARRMGVSLKPNDPVSDAVAIARVALRCGQEVWASSVGEAVRLLNDDGRQFSMAPAVSQGTPLLGPGDPLAEAEILGTYAPGGYLRYSPDSGRFLMGGQEADLGQVLAAASAGDISWEHPSIQQEIYALAGEAAPAAPMLPDVLVGVLGGGTTLPGARVVLRDGTFLVVMPDGSSRPVARETVGELRRSGHIE